MDYPNYLPEEARTWAVEHHELVERVAEELVRTGVWPPLKELTRQLAREQRPTALRSIFWHMPKPLGFIDNNPERVVLTLFGLRLTRAGRTLLDGFIAALKLAATRYQGEDPRPVLTRSDIAGLVGGGELEVTALSELLLRGAPFLGSGFGSAAEDWKHEVTDDIVRYWEVPNVEGYLRLRAAELSQSPQFGWSRPVLASDYPPSAARSQPPERPHLSLGAITGTSPAPEERDVFISHAGKDKDAIARPLAEALRQRGHDVWFDEFELVVGDSLRRSIDHGLAISRFGVVILSPSFFAKEWPQRELDGLTSREIAGDGVVILPVWHEVDREQVASFSSPLADKFAVASKAGIPAIVEQIEKALARGRARHQKPTVRPRPAWAREAPDTPARAAVKRGNPASTQPPTAHGSPDARSRIKLVGEAVRRRSNWVIVTAISAAIAAVVSYEIDQTLSGSGASHTRSRTESRPITALAVGSPTRAYRAASLRSKSSASFKLGQALHFTGYCIGPPVPSLEKGATDVRWLIRPDRTLVPAGQVGGFNTRVAPVACPGQHALEGPSLSSVEIRRFRRKTSIHAIAQASILGFALFEPSSKTWRPIAHPLGRHTSYTVTLPSAQRIAVIAAACWAYGAPAEEQAFGGFVAKVATSPSLDARVAAHAVDASESGARHACAQPAETSGHKAATHHQPQGSTASTSTTGPIINDNPSTVTGFTRPASTTGSESTAPPSKSHPNENPPEE